MKWQFKLPTGLIEKRKGKLRYELNDEHRTLIGYCVLKYLV